MSSQSLITPAMFIVSALVLPIRRNTACAAPACRQMDSLSLLSHCYSTGHARSMNLGQGAGQRRALTARMKQPWHLTLCRASPCCQPVLLSAQ
jgi:hypothetical protein